MWKVSWSVWVHIRSHFCEQILFSCLYLFQFFSANLFYIVKGQDRHTFGVKEKRRLICTLINGMSAHKGDDTMMRNGCLTLFQFRVPDDMVRYADWYSSMVTYACAGTIFM